MHKPEKLANSSHYSIIPGAPENTDLKSQTLDPETHEFIVPQKEVKSALDVQEKWEKSEVVLLVYYL